MQNIRSRVRPFNPLDIARARVQHARTHAPWHARTHTVTHTMTRARAHALAPIVRSAPKSALPPQRALEPSPLASNCLILAVARQP